MYWDKVIIAALLTASPSFGQRLGGLDHFEVVGVGRLFDGDAVKGDWMPTRRNLDEVAGVEEQSQLGELEDQLDIEEEKVVGEEEFFIIDEGAEVEDFEYDSFPKVDKNGFFDLAPHLDAEFVSELTAKDRNNLFGYVGNDLEAAARHLGETQFCTDGRTSFRLEITTDKTSPDHNTFIVNFNGKTVFNKGPFTQGGVSMVISACLPDGSLQVIASDSNGDGMPSGDYSVKLNGVLVADSSGTNAWKSRSHTFDLANDPSTYEISASSSGGSAGTTPTKKPTPKPISEFSGRGTCFQPQNSDEDDWLTAHNTRRKYYHSKYGAEYSPMEYSTELADAAASYAQELLQYCCTSTLVHEKGMHWGENMASNCGTGSWGQKRSADAILTRWAENEADISAYHSKLHFTQVIWRSTKFVGCAHAYKKMDDGRDCWTQVCKYQGPGNCAIDQDTYMTRAMLDSTLAACAGQAVSC